MKTLTIIFSITFYLLLMVVPSTSMASGPTLISPTNLESNVNLPVEFVWNFYPVPVLFHQIQVDNDPAFLSPNIDQTTGVLDTIYTSSSLSYNTQYYWRVRVYRGDISNYSEWSSVNRFTVISNVPQLVSPGNNEIDVLPPYTMEWNQIGGIILYYLQVDDNFVFASPEIDTQFSPLDNIYEPDLDEDTRYFWRVRTLYYVDIYPQWSVWSTEWNFTTATTIPEHISPADGSDHVCFPITINWTEIVNAEQYQYVFRNPATGGTIGNSISFTNASMSEVLLDPFTDYYWRVRAKIDGQWYGFSEEWSLRTGPHHPPEPTLLNPSDAEVNVIRPVTLDWGDIDDVFWFKIMVDNNDDFSSPETDELVNESELEVTNLNSGTEYFWKVRAQNSCYWGEWCTQCSFVTQSLTDIFNIDDEILPDKFALHQNYPNPFNNSTTISFEVPTKEEVSIRIYNILGEEVVTLVNDELSAGTYYLEWDGTDNKRHGVSSGIYLYKLSSESFTQEKKMVLVK